MMWKSMLNLLVTARMVLRDTGEGGGGGAGETPAASVDTSDIQRPDDYPEDAWNSLADHEKAAFSITDEMVEDEEGDLSDDDLAAVAGDDDTSPAAAGDETPAAATPPAAAPAPTGNIPTDEDLLAFRPAVPASEIQVPAVEIPADIQQEITGLEAKLDELDAKFDNAEISHQDYRKEQREINKELSAANRKASEAVFELKAQARDNARFDLESKRTEDAFLNARSEYVEKDDKGEFTLKADALYGALEKAVEKITAQNPGKPLMWRLIEADKVVRNTFGMPPRTAAATPAPTSGKPKPPAAPLPNQPSIRDVPAAGDHDSDPFAYIDRISDPYQRERAINALSDTQRDAYERGAR